MSGPDSMVGPMLGDPIGIDRFWVCHLRARSCPCIIKCIASTSTCAFPLHNSVVLKLEKKIVRFLYSEHLIYGLYMCTCVFLLRQESFDKILVNNPSFYDGVLQYVNSSEPSKEQRWCEDVRPWVCGAWSGSSQSITYKGHCKLWRNWKA
jgi:hypothetical protein